MYYQSETKLKKSNLSQSILRNIKRKEKDLNRICRSIWAFTNPKGEHFIFASYTTGNFPKDKDKVIVTIGYFEKRINRYLSS